MAQRNQCLIPGDDLESQFFRVVAEASPKTIGRGEIIGVIFQNPLENGDGTANANEVWIGNATNQIWLLLPGQESPLIYAEDQKDVYVKRNAAASADGKVFAATLFFGGTGYTVGDILTLSTGGTGATIRVDTIDADGTVLTFTLLTAGSGYSTGVSDTTGGTGHQAIIAAVKNAGGAGYAPNDTFTVNGGGVAATGIVDTVGGGGAVLTFHLTSPGSGYTTANGVATTATLGVGAGFTLNITAASAEFTITSVQGNAVLVALIYRKRKGGLQ